VFADSSIHRIELPAPSFELDVEQFHAEARAAGVDAVIITSPNNPTSMAVPRADLLRLGELLAAEGILLVVDESFVDFCAEGQSMEPELAARPNLVVIKSMSKAYGIGGLRLGYLATANLELVSRLRSELPIWNINGFAESFLRLLPRYQDAFRAGCARVREDRDHLYHRLSRIDGLYVYRPDANYVMVRLPEHWTGPAVTRALFTEHGILIKDCAGKSMADGERFLRIACRTKRENQRLAVALEKVLGVEPAGSPAFAVARTA
jgi:histidinol-phosphate/aromatic aminotransferase/cobyric acid decarboxylase-like protein